MDSEESSQPKGFKVADRRRFSETGEPRDEAPGVDRTSAGAVQSESRAPSGASEPGAERGAPPAPITFATFILSLSTQALAHLGDIPDPIERATRIDLEAARELIDIIGMLREKTRGNLDREEAAQLDESLYALRMRYVDRVQKS